MKRNRKRTFGFLPSSPLRAFDPRSKLWLCLFFSLTVMLPLHLVAAAAILFLIVTIWAGLGKIVFQQISRIWWILLILFVVDWLFVSPELAIIVTLRISMMVGVFSIFFATTTYRELGLALEKLGFPYRFSFSLSLAMQSVTLMQEEWTAIREAQSSRGIVFTKLNFRTVFKVLPEFISLTIPAIVLTTKRAWGITEAAYARGFDTPNRKPYTKMKMQWRDWGLIIFTIVILILIWSYR